MSFKPEFRTGADPRFYGHALRFKTREEAQANANDLERRWMAVVETRVVECEDPVTRTWVNGKLGCIEVGAV